MNIARLLSLFLIIAAFVVASTGCATFRSVEMGTANLAFSAKDESNIGTEYSQQLAKEYQFVNDEYVQNWVRNLGAKLVAASPECPQTFTFNVTTSQEVNAFAIPGGFCYVNAGLINVADTEAEVAAVVGHEINHVTQRHGMRSMQRALGLDIVNQIANIDPRSAAAAQVIAGPTGLVAMRSFGRQDEREADFYGVDAMYKAGYDPRFAVIFFEKLRAGERSGSSLFARALSTHPATQERIDNINKQIAKYDFSKPLVSDSREFQEVKRRIRALIPPPLMATDTKPRDTE
ncbi:M48 family metalloprotease [Candidatus Sumerlaeota bacterium]|nr:M48 family metalloprotease [Candidatus Sumerlaeota bacterium]